ncbi:MAG TPA: hypothetical protein VD927_00960 [Chryseosolibacter sp.]|nr:hypothetical protein [Chryseosolibacter sp.]
MKKLLGWILAILIIFAIAGIVLYKYYLPQMIAEVVVAEETPAYVPKAIQQRVTKYKAPLSKAATDVVREIHESDVSLDQVFHAIDQAEEHDIHMALAELRKAELKKPNDAFNIAKKYIKADFDVEVLREPFNKHVDMDMIRVALKKTDQYNEDALDADLIKAVIKNILLQKEKEFTKETAKE